VGRSTFSYKSLASGTGGVCPRRSTGRLRITDDGAIAAGDERPLIVGRFGSGDWDTRILCPQLDHMKNNETGDLEYGSHPQGGRLRE
jgi:hypothetical protein